MTTAKVPIMMILMTMKMMLLTMKMMVGRQLPLVVRVTSLLLMNTRQGLTVLLLRYCVTSGLPSVASVRKKCKRAIFGRTQGQRTWGPQVDTRKTLK